LKYLLTICISLLAATAACDLPSQGIQDSADIAAATVKDVQSAERRFRRDHGRYAQLEELGPRGANLVNELVASGGQYGYAYEIELTKTGYILRARPQIWGRTGKMSLSSDETEVTRTTWLRDGVK
jgi:hypothetical protein